jgi:hypothetical protein
MTCMVHSLAPSHPMQPDATCPLFYFALFHSAVAHNPCSAIPSTSASRATLMTCIVHSLAPSHPMQPDATCPLFYFALFHSAVAHNPCSATPSTSASHATLTAPARSAHCDPSHPTCPALLCSAVVYNLQCNPKHQCFTCDPDGMHGPLIATHLTPLNLLCSNLLLHTTCAVQPQAPVLHMRP